MLFSEYEGVTGNTPLKAPVVFIHGDFQNSTVFNAYRDFFRAKGHTTLAFDLPGHGSSEFSSEGIDLTWILESLMEKYDVKDPIIMAHSSGGTIAIDYAAKTENCSALVLVNALLSSPAEINPAFTPALFDSHLKMAQKIFKKQEQIDFTQVPEEKMSPAGMQVTDPRGFEKNFNFYLTMPNVECSKLGVPILYIAGKKDQLVPLNYVQEKLKSANARIVEIDAGHHSVTKNIEDVLNVLEKNYHFFGNTP